MSTVPMTTSNFQRFIDDHDTLALAQILRHDQHICSAGGVPSLLAAKLNGISQTLADGIASHLLQGEEALKVPLSILRLQYNEVLVGINAHAQRINHSGAAADADISSNPTLASSELKAALRVLQVLIDSTDLDPNGSVSDAITTIQSHFNEHDEPPTNESQDGVPSIFSPYRVCYICRIRISRATSYPGYPSLCSSCGSFNISSSELSLPANLQLHKKSALVTGGRVNLGFHTALRLLRCGAFVIVTTRYPQDAENRYRQQPDFKEWQSRLRIIGADFRTSGDVFRLASTAHRVLMDWSAGAAQLDILINNAAQTLTDSTAAESKAIAQEEELRGRNGSGQLLVNPDRDYIPRVRGGVQSLTLGMTDPGNMQQSLGPSAHLTGIAVSDSRSLSRRSTRPPSSWTQTLSEIPYEDVISAHSVNTFVPLILIRELLPLMGTASFVEAPPLEPQVADPTNTAKPALLHPAAYIINVSSREGIFDSLQSSNSFGSAHLRKTPHHVHTNMSKAALNMITETEAAACWHDKRVCMNSVDPGFMSAAPGFGENIPLGWEDGAGRVLWPVAVGWGKEVVRNSAGGRAVWGRFLKHYRPSQWGGEAF